MVLLLNLVILCRILPILYLTGVFHTQVVGKLKTRVSAFFCSRNILYFFLYYYIYISHHIAHPDYMIKKKYFERNILLQSCVDV